MKSNIALIIALTSLSSIANAGDWLSSWSVELGVSSIYDDNILRYSDKYLTLFTERQDEGRFHVNTRDDVILVSSIRGMTTLKLVQSLPTTLTVDFKQRMFTGNGIKDWSTYEVNARQGLGKRFAAGVGYNYSPYFYVRHYLDGDWASRYGDGPESYQPFDFAKDEIEGWVQKMLFNATRVRVGGLYSRYFYNEHFTEYDCTNKTFSIDLGQPLSRNLRLTFKYAYELSRAKGDANTDPSYNEDAFGLGAVWSLPDILGRDNSLRVTGEYARRCFTTDHALEVDPLHAGRVDYATRLSVAYECKPLKKFALALNAAWQSRDAQTQAVVNADYLSAERDFRQFQVGLEVKYIIRYVAPEESEFEEDE
ncbi:MAG: hypothetical protein HY961_17560 [Ignavibacteriae bacterium]|nr:hypothetical protein [Ignavibacteriota bacterium]